MDERWMAIVKVKIANTMLAAMRMLEKETESYGISA
jgi:hypothetical protein